MTILSSMKLPQFWDIRIFVPCNDLGAKVSKCHTSVAARSSSSQVVILDETETGTDVGKVLLYLLRVLHVVDDLHPKLGTAHHTFNLTRVRDGGETVYGVLELVLEDLGQLLLVLEEAVRELQT